MEYVLALVPSIGTAILFYVVVRAMINADRNERAALRRLDAEAEAKEQANPPR
ncbi:hypothetical protein MF406_03035 [Georgenia sp. TF02-10]|uniref:hypothetical protein n=1 Tax=Georgenia sp. TF02-10 TaxID=2917725 RepID=UPI001FA7DB92|nr:hypothetical protein [Georgenia sp. TF02-10]UNX55265.1 hypothetical protein MF406_03035 [Georgenia sp. TF02-10]